MEIKTKIVRSVLSNGLLGWMQGGYGNGYVGVPPDHPWYAKDCEDMDITVHGGITWSSIDLPISAGDEEGNYWWVGFDTMHYGDNITNCSKEFVEAETNRLYQQAWAVYNYIPPREDTDHRELDIDL